MTIELIATDDGLPDPPGALTYAIQSLPDCELRDAGDEHVITAGELPYTLTGGGNQVIYRPFSKFFGQDSFQFFADDGGTPPQGGPSNVATVSVTIGVPDLVYSFPLDTDPGWDTQGEWAFGVPTGSGSFGRDPTSGHTGQNVYGYNLDGDYTNSMPMYTLTTEAMDCSNLVCVELHFWRWLGIEASPFDQATVDVSTGAASWVTVWAHTGPSLSETSWSHQVLDLSTWADGRATVYVRWTMGPTDLTTTYPGWNLDDIEIWGVVPMKVGDMNCDGVLNFADIDPFVLAMSNRKAYQALHNCNYWLADINGDGAVDFADIDAFVAALTGP